MKIKKTSKITISIALIMLALMLCAVLFVSLGGASAAYASTSEPATFYALIY